MQCNLAVIKGDGIGPEVVTEAMKVLDTVGEKFGHTFDYEQILMGGCSQRGSSAKTLYLFL